MDAWGITLAVLRRWFVALPVLLVTAAGVYLVGPRVAPEYVVRATWMLVPGSTPVESRVDGPNPYGNISGAAGAVEVVLSSPQTRQQLGESGLIATYQITAESRATIIHMTLRATSAEVGIRTGEALHDLAVEELSSRQSGAGVRPEVQYGLVTLSQPAVIEVVTDDRTQLRAIVAAGGLVAAVVLAALVDGVILKLRGRRAARPAALDDSPEPGSTTTQPETGSTGRETEVPDGDPDDAEPHGEQASRNGTSPP